MSTYRKEWDCCGSVTETEAWEPDHCPFCAVPPESTAAILQAQGEPEGWRAFIEQCLGFAGQMVNGNLLSREAGGLLKRPSQAQEPGGGKDANQPESRMAAGNDRGGELSVSGAVDELPPLPESCRQVLPFGWIRYTADQMREYAALSRAQATQPAQPPFPERDPSIPAEQQGLFRKFEVRRVDGSDQPGGKHYGCRYYVLDLDHDQHAPAAMQAYATECRATHPQLADDIEAEFGAQPAQQAPAVSGEPKLCDYGNEDDFDEAHDEWERAQRNAEVGAMEYNGNTVSYMYSKARNYGNVLVECCKLIGGSGHIHDRIMALLQERNELRALLSQPAAAPVSEQTVLDVDGAAEKVISLLKDRGMFQGFGGGAVRVFGCELRRLLDHIFTRNSASSVSEMVNRFLGWRLPKDFCPDCGISFDGRKDDQWNKNKTWPIGTNLLTADQARAMFQYCLADPSNQSQGGGK